MTKQIKVTNENGEEYIVTFDIPVSIAGDADKEWKYTCSFIDDNLLNVKEWEE